MTTGKTVLKHLLLGLALMVLATSVLGLADDAFERTGHWHEDVFTFIGYYLLWVFPYWWLIILLGSLAIALVLNVISAKMRSRKTEKR